ncbi:MAG: hypothetical protein V7K92_07200 [Nostoc sp.]|uniref:hypothetical protein n=1 Tax=Nostoc sp. TaxID=1180 RepID=UPI002FF14C08
MLKFNTLVRTVAVVSIGFATTWGVANDAAKAVGFTVDSITLGSLTDGSDSTVKATTGSKIYGYSLFSPDVNDRGNPINLLDWTNASVFPKDTPNTVGGIDLAATNVGVVKAVPKPSFVADALLFSTFVIAAKLKNRVKKNSNL